MLSGIQIFNFFVFDHLNYAHNLFDFQLGCFKSWEKIKNVMGRNHGKKFKMSWEKIKNLIYLKKLKI